MIAITDISPIKWAEDLQTRRLAEAEENRRAQNSFIDITSHEMRNPLSAILQCADGIISSLGELMSADKADFQWASNIIRDSITSVETIQLCAQHQKNIVNEYVGQIYAVF
jgi:signal transduction histidine kinase